jgi:hypothetical protein
MGGKRSVAMKGAGIFAPIFTTFEGKHPDGGEIVETSFDHFGAKNLFLAIVTGKRFSVTAGCSV